MSIETTKPKIGLLLGRNRPQRICDSIADWVLANFSQEKIGLEKIDLREVNLPFLDEIDIPAHHRYRLEHTLSWSQTVGSFDGFILLFPQYNWGYPAVLKNAIDYLYDEWRGKPVSIMCYGGHGGFQAEIAIRLVLQGLKMQILATNVALTINEEMFGQDGQFTDIDRSFNQYRQSLLNLPDEFSAALR